MNGYEFWGAKLYWDAIAMLLCIGAVVACVVLGLAYAALKDLWRNWRAK